MINTDWRGRAKPGPWYGQYYRDWDARHPGAWIRGQLVPGGFYSGNLWGSSTLEWDAEWFRTHGAKMPKGAHYIRPGRNMTPLSTKHKILVESAQPLGRERQFEGGGLLDIMRALQSV